MQEAVSLGGSRCHRVSEVLFLLLLGHSVQLVFDAVDLGLDLVALVRLHSDLRPGFLQLLAALPDGLLMLRARLRVQRFEFEEGLLFIDRRAGLLVALSLI